MMLRKVYEITGYALHGSTYCVDCLPVELRASANPITLGDETDHKIHCETCKDEIETTVLNFCEIHQSYDCDCFDRN